MMDNASPRDGWSHSDYSKYAPIAKADTFGALFFMLRDLLLQFCERIRKDNVSFELLCIDAIDIESHVSGKCFDRIEVCCLHQRF